MKLVLQKKKKIICFMSHQKNQSQYVQFAWYYVKYVDFFSAWIIYETKNISQKRI